jgi:hypothetical protein
VWEPVLPTEPGDDELAEDEQTRLFGFRAAHVFDVSQTEGDPLPEFAKISGDPQDATEHLKQFILTKSIALEYDERIRPANGLSSGGKITVLPGLSSAEEFSVLVHETAHSADSRIMPRAFTCSV